jgi:hypothetical protein
MNSKLTHCSSTTTTTTTTTTSIHTSPLGRVHKRIHVQSRVVSIYDDKVAMVLTLHTVSRVQFARIYQHDRSTSIQQPLPYIHDVKMPTQQAIAIGYDHEVRVRDQACAKICAARAHALLCVGWFRPRARTSIRASAPIHIHIQLHTHLSTPHAHPHPSTPTSICIYTLHGHTPRWLTSSQSERLSRQHWRTSR